MLVTYQISVFYKMDKTIEYLEKTFIICPMKEHAEILYLTGINTGHDPEFVFDWTPQPPRRAFISCFRTEAVILSSKGMERIGLGDCIVQDSGLKMYHSSVPGASEGFRNDWMHLDYSVVFKVMKQLKLPWNRLIRTGRPELMADYIRAFSAEAEEKDGYCGISIGNRLSMMLIDMSRSARAYAMRTERMTSTESSHYDRFMAIRADMIGRCTEEHTVGSLAHEAGLSPERFAFLYRKFFSSTPISDMIDARMLVAKRILSYSRKSVKETALECGFGDFYYFSRIFKSRTGCSPVEFRRGYLPRITRQHPEDDCKTFIGVP